MGKIPVARAERLLRYTVTDTITAKRVGFFGGGELAPGNAQKHPLRESYTTGQNGGRGKMLSMDWSNQILILTLILIEP